MLMPFAWYLLEVIELGGKETIVTHIDPNGPDRFLSVHSLHFKASYYSYGVILSAIGILLNVALSVLSRKAKRQDYFLEYLSICISLIFYWIYTFMYASFAGLAPAGTLAMLALQITATLVLGRYCLMQCHIVDKALAVAAGPLLVAVLAHVVALAPLLQASFFLPYLFLLYAPVLVATFLLLRSHIRQRV